MGNKIAPSFAQSVMNSLFGPDGNIEVFMDDIAIFTNGNFQIHLEALCDVLLRLSRENFRINKSKCTFAATKVDYLGHAITSSGIKPNFGEYRLFLI